MKAKRIMMAMSGGVDSSLAAALLREAGHELIGVTVRGWTPPWWSGEDGDKSCCSLAAVEDARAVAQQLDIPFYVLNFSDAFFQDIVEPFATTYLCGRTPNPCVACNRHIRFDRLYRKARELECQAVATGHFARVWQHQGRWQLGRGVDHSKDQSYMLYTASQEALAMTIYPLGNMTKPQVRNEAALRKLPTASRPESQDICFVPDGNYAGLIEALHPGEIKPGPIFHVGGSKLGQHQGLCHHTIGQRRGLGLAWPEPLYVVGFDVGRNALVVGEHNHLYRQDFEVEDVNWIAWPALSGTHVAKVKIRYRAEPVDGTLSEGANGRCVVHLHEPQRAIAAGQAAVFYDGDTVLGGGTIVPA